jgi:hypothetical protein
LACFASPNGRDRNHEAALLLGVTRVSRGVVHEKLSASFCLKNKSASAPDNGTDANLAIEYASGFCAPEASINSIY